MVWETASHNPVRELQIKGNAVALFSPDGEWLVTGSADEYRLWQAGSWEPGLAIKRDRAGDMYGAMAFSPDSRMLALLRGRNSEVQLISVPDGVELARLDTGRPLCFSPNGRFLTTAGDDNRSIFVWDLRLIRQQLAALRLDWGSIDNKK
jgi:WD40 repeat protein